MTQQIIPVTLTPYSEFTVDLESLTWRMRTRWNETDAAWYLDLEGISDSSINFKGIKIVSGCNLLKPFVILQLGGLYLIDREDKLADPDYDNFGTRYALLYVGLDEPESIW